MNPAFCAGREDAPKSKMSGTRSGFFRVMPAEPAGSDLAAVSSDTEQIPVFFFQLFDIQLLPFERLA